MFREFDVTLSTGFGAGFGLETSIGPIEGPVAFNAAIAMGFATAWRVGLAVPPAPEGVSITPFAGFLSETALSIVNPRPPLLFPTRLAEPYGGLRIQVANRHAWLAVAPSLVGGQPDLPTAWNEAKFRSAFGLTPPLIEAGWNLQPGLALIFRTAFPLLAVRVSL